MAVPSKKSRALEKFLSKIGGVSREETIRSNKCISVECGGDALEFKDALCRKEYTISGFCQKCQDRVFLESFDDDVNLWGYK